MNELIVDCFAGGGGASQGIRMALGRDPDITWKDKPRRVRVTVEVGGEDVK
jgi:DNA (cytosine-5)-methyltransferase 1